LKSQLIPWLQKNKFEVCIADCDSFWGLRNIAKESKELQSGRRNLLKWYLFNAHKKIQHGLKLFFFFLGGERC
jgi:hypothetical protein